MEISSSAISCHECGARLHRERPRSREGLLLQVGGWEKITHVPKRCHNAECGRKCRTIWYNYIQVATGRYWLCNDDPPAYFFITPTVGFSLDWLRQFHCRLAYQHCSFMSEAKVHLRIAYSKGIVNLVPVRSADYMARVWVLWRVLARVHQNAVQSSKDPVEAVREIDFAATVPRVLREVAPWYHPSMALLRVQQFHAGEKDATLLVMDGNQKLRRRVRGYPYCEHIVSEPLGLGMWRCCSKGPLQRPGKRRRPSIHIDGAIEEAAQEQQQRPKIARCSCHAARPQSAGLRASTYDIVAHRQKRGLIRDVFGVLINK